MARRFLVGFLLSVCAVVLALPLVAWLYAAQAALGQPGPVELGAGTMALPRPNQGWLRFDHVLFIDTQGNLVDAGRVYTVQGPTPAVRQPIVPETCRGIAYQLKLPGWHTILFGGAATPPSFDLRRVEWSDVAYTGAGH